MSHERRTTEYAIEVPGRGFIGWAGFLQDSENLTGLREFDTAAHVLESTRESYIRMGCPEIAETIRIVSRTITHLHGDWGVPVPVVRKGIDAL